RGQLLLGEAASTDDVLRRAAEGLFHLLATVPVREADVILFAPPARTVLDEHEADDVVVEDLAVADGRPRDRGSLLAAFEHRHQSKLDPGQRAGDLVTQR